MTLTPVDFNPFESDDSGLTPVDFNPFDVDTPAEAEAEEGRTWGEVAGDTGAAVMGGFASLVDDGW